MQCSWEVGMVSEDTLTLMNLVIFDLETTGLSASLDDIIQIAAVRMRMGEILETEFFSTYVRPTRPVPSFITSFTGITNAQVERAPKPITALAEFSRFTGDSVLIAHNGARFDMPFIRESCARLAIPVRPVEFIDSIAFSRKVWGGRAGHGLDAVMTRLEISAAGHRRHDARSDVRILAEAVRRMWSRLTPDFGICPVDKRSGVLPVI